MSSVDERIVIIKFDNDEFERNVAQSQKTLDKLKEKLKLDGATKGLEAVSASAKSFSFGNIGDAVDSLKDRFSTLGVVGMTVIQNLTNKVTDFAIKVGGQIISGGIRRAQNLEQANFMLEGLFGDVENKAEKVQEIMTAANNAVSGTAYGLDEAAKVASQLVASGIQDGEKMEFVLRGIAGTAAMTGGSYEELGNIFTTVAGSGKLMTEQLRQFEHRGLNVAATLAKELGTTEVEIREMVHDGEIDFETFSVALANAFGEHAQEANKTFAGSLSNVRAALSRLGAKVATPELQNLRDIFNVLAPMIDAVSKALQPLIDMLNNGLRKATNRGVEALTTFFLAFGGDAETLVAKTQYMSDEAKEHMNATIAKFGEVQLSGGNFFTKLREKITGTSEVVTETADTMEEQAGRIGMSAEEIDEYANRVLNGEFGDQPERQKNLEALGVSFELVQNRVNELLGCEYRYEVATDAAAESTNRTTNEMRKLSSMEKKLSGTTEKMAEETEDVASPLENLGAGFKNIGSSLKTVGEALASSFTNVFSVNDFTNAISFLANGFRKLTEKFKLSDKAAKGLQTVFEAIFTVARYGLIVIGKIIGVAGKAVGLIGTGINRLLEKIWELKERLKTSKAWTNFWTSISEAAQAAGQKFSEFKDRVKNAIEQLKNTEGFQKLQASLEKLWGVIKDLAGKIFDRLSEKFKAFASTKGDFSWLDAIVNFLDKAAGKLADFIDSFINGTDPIHKFFDNFKDKNTGKFGKFVGFLTAAKDAIVGFFTGLFGGGDAEDAAKGGLSQWFNNFFGNLFSDKGGFFSDEKKATFIQSIKDFFKQLWEDAQGIDWTAVAEKVKEIGKVIIEFAFLIETLRLIRSARKTIKAAGGMFESIGGFFGGLTKKGGLASILGSIHPVAQAFLALGALVGTIAISLYRLSKIKPEDLTRSVKAMSVLLIEIIGMLGLIKLMKLDPAQMTSFGASMAGLGVGMLLLVGAIKLLSGMQKSEFKKGAIALLEIMTMLAFAARLAGKSTFGTLVGMALAVDMLVPALWVLGTMKKRKLEQGILAILAVTMELAVAARIAGRSSFGTLIGMALAVDLLVPALWVLGNMEADKLKQGAIALGAIMLAISVAVRIAGSSASAAKGALAMTVPLVAAAISLWALTKIDQEALKKAAIALGGTMLAIAVALRIAQTKDFMGVGGFLILLGSLTLAFKLLTDMDCDAVLTTAEGLALAALGLAAALRLIAPIGAMAGPAIVGILVFDAFVADLIGVLAGLGALSRIDGFNELISDGAGVFGQLGKGLGNFVGGIIEGIGEGISGILPELGTDLSSFAENAETFLSKIKECKSDTVDSVANLAKAVLIIAGTEFLNAITDGILFGTNSIEKFGGDLVTLADYLCQYSEKISGGNFDSGAVTASANAAKMLAEMAAIVPNQGGLLADIIGDNTMTQFAAGLKPFADALVDYSDAVSGENIDVEAIKASAAGAEALANMADVVPNEGGKLAELIGDNTLTQFAAHLAPFGKALADYSDVVTGRNIDSDAIKQSADGAKALADMADVVPNEGGKIADLIGDNTLTQFAAHLKPFGEALADYSDAVKGGAIDKAAIDTSVAAASSVVGLADIIPNDGGLWGLIVGNNDLGSFSEGLTTFGTAIADYSKAVTGLDTVGIDNSVVAVGTLIGIKTELGQNGYSTGWTNNLTNFGNDLKGFATPFKTFCDAIAGLTSSAKLQNVVSTIPDIVTAISGASDANISSSNVTNFATGLTETGTALMSFSNDVSGALTRKMQTVSEIVQTDLISMTNKMSTASTSNVVSYAETLVTVGEKLNAFGSNISTINTGILTSVADSVSQIASMQTSMQNAGNSISSDFSNSMSKAASTGIDNMVSGITSGASSVGKATAELASTAVKGLSNLATEFKSEASKASSAFVEGLKGSLNSAYLKALELSSQVIKGVSGITRSMSDYGTSAGEAFVRGIGASQYNSWSRAYAVATNAVSGATSGASSKSFYDIGSNAVQGMINGFGARYWDLYWKAYRTAKAAADAAKSALKEASPSKVFYEIGDFAVQGFVNAFSAGDKVVQQASTHMANLAIKETEAPFKELQNAIDLSIDSNPTIKPVLDLSNIQKGAGLIGGMLNRNTPQLALANAGAFGGIQNMAASRAIQTDNRDVVNAIDGLRNSMGNTTFNITVDGTTSPEEFVDKLVRIVKNRSRV